MIATNSDSSVVLLLLVWFIFVDHLGVCNLSTAVGWDVFVADDTEGVRTFGSLISAIGTLANTLA